MLYAYARYELHDIAASSARELLGDEPWMEAHEEGSAMSFEEAVAFAFDSDTT